MKTRIKYLKTIALVWIACLVLFVLAHLFVLSPQKKLRKQTERRLTAIRQMFESVLSMSEEKNKIALNEQIRHLEETMKDYVIDFEDSANLTLDISEVAKKYEIDSLGIKSNADLKGSKLRDWEHITENYIDVSFNGDFKQFAAFLNALERYRPVVFVDSFTVARSSKENLGHRVTMRLAIYVKTPQTS